MTVLFPRPPGCVILSLYYISQSIAVECRSFECLDLYVIKDVMMAFLCSYDFHCLKPLLGSFMPGTEQNNVYKYYAYLWHLYSWAQCKLVLNGTVISVIDKEYVYLLTMSRSVLSDM